MVGTATRRSARLDSRAFRPAPLILAAAAFLAACTDAPITGVPLAPDAPLLAVGGGLHRREIVKVCQDDSNVPAGTTFQFSVSNAANPVTVTAGLCANVLVTGTLKSVTVSQLPKSGFTLDSVKKDVGTGHQLASDPVTCSASATTGCVIIYYNHKDRVITYSGEATVVRARTLLGIDLTLVKAGPLPLTGGSDAATLLTADVPGLLTARLLGASTQAGGGTSQSNATIADLNLAVSGLVVSADVVESTANAACVNGNESVSGKSKLVNLWIGGKQIAVTGAPNQTIYLLGLGKVVINEHVKTSDSITVNAIHVSLGLLADVVISQSHADIHC